MLTRENASKHRFLAAMDAQDSKAWFLARVFRLVRAWSKYAKSIRTRQVRMLRVVEESIFLSEWTARLRLQPLVKFQLRGKDNRCCTKPSLQRFGIGGSSTGIRVASLQRQLLGVVALQCTR
mmetsp:Transcript_10913/g.67417  ORF Transcript_10913/g.67417 Transcript_10913/m.67417 type:complete len:122 (-) Transcript_10913:984-1349(-)